MRSVLLLTYHFPPSAASGAFRLLGFAQHLPRCDWRCIVVAPPSLPWEPVDPSLSARVPAETVVCSVPYPGWLPKVIRWLAPYDVWLPWARSAACRAVAQYRPSAVITSGPPHGIHLIGQHLQGRYRLPWIADFRDPWITSSSFVLRINSWRKRIEHFFERRVMRRADLILANAPFACEEMRQAFPDDARRITYLTNGFDPEAFPPAATERSGPVRILHAGQLYEGRDPRPVLDSLAHLPPDAPPVTLEFIGRSVYQDGADLAADVQQRGVEAKVRLLGQMTYQQTLLEMSKADVLLLMDTPGRKIGVPAKLYEYLGAGKPILATGEYTGDLAAILSQSGMPFRVVPPNNPQAIAEGIADLSRLVVAGQAVATSESARLQFSRANLASRLAGMLNELVARRGRHP